MLRATEVVTGKNTRFSYLNANEPKPTQDGTRLKYSSSLIIPKSDVITKEKIEAAIRSRQLSRQPMKKARASLRAMARPFPLLIL